MSRLGFGAKPVVLRCSRCGRFVDWEEARLQVACGCRTKLELPPVLVRDATAADRAAAIALIRRDFGQTSIVSFGEPVSLDGAPILAASMKGELAGALAYRLLPDALQILALATDPMWQRTGVGGHLVAEAEAVARSRGLGRIILATTNDNLPALYFYQRRNYLVTALVPGAILPHLKVSSSGGFGGIPIRDEIRLEKKL
ncbi:MAG: GNAT family N-acetyltransferase [Vicinamibacterales bacterium]